MESLHFVYIGVGIYALTGLLSLLFGYRLIQWLIALSGAIFFGAMAGALAPLFAKSAAQGMLCMGAGALVGGLVSFALYKFFLFLQAGLITGVLTYLLLKGTGALPFPYDVVAAVAAGLLAGGLLLILFRPALIVFSSLSGASTLVSSATLLSHISREPLPATQEEWTAAGQLSPEGLLIALVVAVFGMFFQFATTKEETSPSSGKKKKGGPEGYTSPFAFLHDDNWKSS